MQTGSFQPLSSQGNFYRKLDQANSSEIENAFSLILNEISKRDQRIRELEEQLLSLRIIHFKTFFQDKILLLEILVKILVQIELGITVTLKKKLKFQFQNLHHKLLLTLS